MAYCLNAYEQATSLSLLCQRRWSTVHEFIRFFIGVTDLLKLSFIVGLTGAVLTFLGSSVAIFIAEITQYGSEYKPEDNLQGNGLIGIALSLFGLMAVAKVRSRPRSAATVMVIASVFGLAILKGYFLVGAVLLLLAAYYAIRGYYFSS